MSDYRPPLRDIQFVLEHVVDLGGLAELPGFDHVDEADVYDALAEAGRFFSEVVAPTNRVGDSEGVLLETDGSVRVPDSMVAGLRVVIKL